MRKEIIFVIIIVVLGLLIAYPVEVIAFIFGIAIGLLLVRRIAPVQMKSLFAVIKEKLSKYRHAKRKEELWSKIGRPCFDVLEKAKADLTIPLRMPFDGKTVYTHITDSYINVNGIYGFYLELQRKKYDYKPVSDAELTLLHDDLQGACRELWNGLAVTSVRNGDDDGRSLKIELHYYENPENLHNHFVQYEQSRQSILEDEGYIIPPFTENMFARGNYAWLLDADQLRNDRERVLPWHFGSTLLSGTTGAGKTTANRLLLASAAETDRRQGWNTHLWIIDYKREFAELEDRPTYFGHVRCGDGMKAFDALFDRRIERSGEITDDDRVIIVIDEWAAFLNAQSKKDADEHRKRLARWGQLGRSLQVAVILSAQDASSSYFGTTGVRDQFSSGCVCTFGTQSDEAIRMLYSPWRDEIRPVQNKGEGFMVQNGEFFHVQVPHIMDRSIFTDRIRHIMRD